MQRTCSWTGNFPWRESLDPAHQFLVPDHPGQTAGTFRSLNIHKRERNRSRRNGSLRASERLHCFRLEGRAGRRTAAFRPMGHELGTSFSDMSTLLAGLGEQRNHKHQKAQNTPQRKQDLWSANEKKQGCNHANCHPWGNICPGSGPSPSRHAHPERPQQQSGPDKTAAPDVVVPGIKDADEQARAQASNGQDSHECAIQLLPRE